MGSRSRPAALAALALALAASCRVNLDSIRTGGEWTAEEVSALAVGTDGRADVLRRLGPPDAVFYTLVDEVFVYRRGGHRGTDLRFLFPNFFNLLRPGLELLTPGVEQDEAFEDETAPVMVTNTVIDRVFAFMNPLATEEGMALYGRRLRWDVARITLDRETHVARSVDLFLGVEEKSAEDLFRETLLLDRGEPAPPSGPLP